MCDVLMSMSRARALFESQKKPHSIFSEKVPFFSDFFFFIGTKTRDAGRIDKKAIDGGEGKCVR